MNRSKKLNFADNGDGVIKGGFNPGTGKNALLTSRRWEKQASRCRRKVVIHPTDPIAWTVLNVYDFRLRAPNNTIGD